MSFVTVVPNIIVEAVSAVVDIVLDVIDSGFFDDSVADRVTTCVRVMTASGGADHAAEICRTLL